MADQDGSSLREPYYDGHHRSGSTAYGSYYGGDEGTSGYADADVRRSYGAETSSRANESSEGLGPLVKLVEALEMYDGRGGGSDSLGMPNDLLDTYASEDVESQLLSNPMKGHRAGRSIAPSMAETYTSEMNPKLKRKVAPMLEDEEPEDEFCAAPFTYNAIETNADFEDDRYFKGDWPQKRFRRRTRINFLGMSAFLIYVVALIFYIWIRVTKTLDLGIYTWWGIIVFIVEMLGASTTLLYGANLLYAPYNEPLPADLEHHGLTKVEHPYHVRVLVPTYKETLDIVAKTVHAAYNAPLPVGCMRTIYVCDDGKDSSKRRWVEQMGPEIVYVSGRTRAVGEMNGKSANLNNCASQIYPDDLGIPPNELICIFDADQVCNADFFLKTLPLFDAGDDVGMVLSPQCFHNVDVGADVFNHANVQFWEYAQTGYDALDFISCTGTNFLIRSTAFREAGWSPEYTLTEDYALGMELTRLHWHCRYVNEYLAIGEAPHETRNCFQQRSRWCKGHFQIVLNPDHCPIFVPGLTAFQKIMYCSGVWAYIVGAITTPFFIVVPLVTIWGGVFPIIVSWWSALGLTVYFIAQYGILNYVRNRKHVGPLWFANVANNILWWTFVKGFWRAFSGTKLGNTLTFKTTLKGSSKFMNQSIGDLWIPTLCFLGLAASFGFGLDKVIKGGSVATTLSISLVWIIYGSIPPLLLLWYNFIGRGATLRIACRICFYLSFTCGVLALVLLWLVYPREVDYNAALQQSYQFYGSQMVGRLSQANPVLIPAFRSDALTYEAGPPALKFGDLVGGFITGGSATAAAGAVKLTIPIAYSTAFLAWGFLYFPQGISKAEMKQPALDTLKWGTDYLLKTFEVDSDPEHKTPNRTQYNIIYQVGNYTAEKALWGRLEEYTKETHPRPAYYTTTYNATSDLVGQMVGAFVSTAMVWQQEYPGDEGAAYYDTLMTAAVNLYGAGSFKGNKYSNRFIYECAPAGPTQLFAAPSRTDCPPVDEVFLGSMVGQYNSTSYFDDLAWAAAWLFKATKDPAYLNDAVKYFNKHTYGEENIYDKEVIVNWDNLVWPVTLMLADLTGTKDYHDRIQEAYLAKWLCSTGGLVSYTQLGRAYNTYEPSLGQTMNAAFLAAVYGALISPNISTLPGAVNRYSSQGRSNRYTCFARTQSRYALGTQERSYVGAFGKNPPSRLQDRDASCPMPPEPCNNLNALLNPDPNPNLLVGALTVTNETWDYIDDSRMGVDTRIGLENNAGYTALLTAMNQVAGSYNLCLQGYGILDSDTVICSGDALASSKRR